LPVLHSEHVVIDGKTLRDSRQPGSHHPNGEAVHLMGAFVVRHS